jgi:signal transduction histidine kinase
VDPRALIRLVVLILTVAFAVADRAGGVALYALLPGVAGVVMWCAVMPSTATPLLRYCCGALIGVTGMFGTLCGSAAASVALGAGVALIVGAYPMSVAGVALSGSALVAAGAGTWLAGPARLDDSSAVVVPVAVGVILGLRGMDAARQRQHQRRLHEAEMRVAAAEERARLGRDLHDVLAHSLGALVIQLDALGAVVDRRSSDTDVVRRVHVAREMAAQGLDDARKAVHDLRRFTEPVEQLLTRLADQLTGRAGGRLHVTVTGSAPPLPEAVTDLLGAVAVEGMNNIRRHGNAEVAHAQVCYSRDRVRLCLQNEASEPAGNAGMGLRGLHERALAVGAEVVARWEAGVWELCCDVPL